MSFHRQSAKPCEIFVKLLTFAWKYAIMYHRKQQRRCFGICPEVPLLFFYYTERMYYYETD